MKILQIELESNSLIQNRIIQVIALMAVGGALPAVASNADTPHMSVPPSPAASSSVSDDGVLSIAVARARAKSGVDFTTKAAGEPITHPLLPSECIARFKSPCYGPEQLRHLYGVDKLGHIDGGRRTVALIEPGVDPVLRNDLDVYSRQAGLPAPKLTVIRQGHPKELDKNDPVQAVTAEELELDAEMIHMTAPGATIVDVQTEDDVANGIGGFGGAIDVIAKLAARGVDAVSLSYGWFEQNYTEEYGPGKDAAVIRSQAAGLVTAARNHMTVLSANGDTGPTGPTLSGDKLYPNTTAAFIATHPLVTAVAGTELHADDAGNRLSPDTAWGEHDGDQSATGGALSHIFARPGYQDRIRGIVGTHRGNTDVAMDGSTASRVWIYTSKYQVLSGQQPGWVRAAGTSAASPMFAGIVTDAAQLAGHRLGPINTALYRLARTPSSSAAAGIADVTTGCNTITGVQGFCARPGWDLVSGVGTVGNAARFVHALAAAALQPAS